MKHVKKSVLLWYSAHEMYALVTAVEDYPRFLPWCEKVDILQRDAAGLTARLHLGYAACVMRSRPAMRTRRIRRCTSASSTAVLAPRRDLALSVAAAAVRRRVEGLQDRVRTALCLLERGTGSADQPGLRPDRDTFVDAFVKRAEQVYGTR
jgi:hypothetical protein